MVVIFRKDVKSRGSDELEENGVMSNDWMSWQGRSLDIRLLKEQKT